MQKYKLILNCKICRFIYFVFQNKFYDTSLNNSKDYKIQCILYIIINTLFSPFSCLYKVKMLIPYQNGISPVPYMGKSRQVATFIKEQVGRG